MNKTVGSVIFEHLVVFIFLWEVLRAEDYVIIQRKRSTSSGSNTWKAQPDQFIIPSSLCSDNGSTQCKEMGGSRIGNCKCECNHTQASNSGDYSSSTFGFDGGRWKCLENAKVHERSGCSVILNNWANDSALTTVPDVGVANYEIPTQFRHFHIYKATSRAQNCDNSWMHLDYDTYVKEIFSVHEIDSKQYLKFNYSVNSSQQITTGRIIKLGVAYYDVSNKLIHSCVLLKMHGEIQCPFSLPPTATPSTTTPSFLSTTVESSLSTSTRIATNPNPNTPNSNISGFPTVTKSTGETSVPMVIKTSSKNTSSEDRSGLIAGAVAGVIGFIALVIVIILVRRRKKRTTIAKRTDVVQGHNGFGTHHVQRSLEDDQEEYSYAYASAVSINKQNMDHHPKNKESPIPAADYVNQGNSDLNVSDELEYEIMTNTETDESKAIKQKQETSDQTLNSTMYCSLVGNVPHIYGSLKGPHKTHEDETDRQVTCTGQNKENDTYQQLNTFGQQNHGEYQAPNWST